ncbi:Polyketide synthase [Penicillium taxi]|uniref:Polyketide synthase n=1 Tax=Penicillium taxi TaxID=168475 RepID=UPI00254579FF|nr:Polyketide synthase [Penicillium taxi]KAJ5893429.1 Polyketide synthase [Penicillium taxi]
MDPRETPSKTVLVFGPQALAFNQNSFHDLRAAITNSAALGWVPSALLELPDCFETVSKEFPHLTVVPGVRLLHALSEWFATGSLKNLTISPHIPNTILTPITVLSQLAAYDRYIDLRESGGLKGSHALANTESAGFCTGLLAALAVSLSDNNAELAHNGATVLRLAMLIGAVVDAQESTHGGSTSVSAVWRTPNGLEALERILQDSTDAYISVRYDEDRATVTTSRDGLAGLVAKASLAGITTKEIGLSGSFHSEDHRGLLDLLSRFCDSNPPFRLLAASELRIPCRRDITETGENIMTGNLSAIALEALLVKQSQWWNTFSSFCSVEKEAATIITLGPERCTPPSLLHKVPPGFQFIHLANVPAESDNGHLMRSLGEPDHDIAVIGMSCKVSGADDLDEFWEILCKGESQHTEVPKSRFSFETGFRDFDPEKKWYGNFIKDYNAFDNRFFKKSPREAASMDPQQRLLLEVAYQAVEQSGYFQKKTPSSDVGCYIGTCAVDYENNVGCHAPNAFSSTGNLRGFIAGKVSHYFGWTGPGLTLDTACSGAAVAIHQACSAIFNGECETALAGGVNMISQPLAYQNLAAASFLSPTGQFAAVFLKRKSAAIADGDQIFGIISSTAVSQNRNCTPIFVPNAPSLSDLFRKVLSKAHLEPRQISYVEAHGTGTSVGDPAEYESISQVFAIAKRAKALQLGSVKGLVGHTESTSGLVSLIKVLLMMHESSIPPQASFRTMNPHIKASTSIAISTSSKPWSDEFKAALINNYGASGSNASMIVTKPLIQSASVSQVAGEVKYPFWLSALDDKSLHAKVSKLKTFFQSKSRNVPISTVSFNISRQSNRQLNRAIMISCSTIQELNDKLSGDLSIIDRPSSRPVVLCFGGQVSTFVGLDRSIVENTTVFRSHLNDCDKACQSLGFGSIYPAIFQRSAIEDTVKLQLCILAVQYASAKSWIDCGIQPSALVGHSFGELTALCISEALSLEDTVKMIAGRAGIVRDQWGPEKGAMMAVEADLHQVTELVQMSDSLSIACYNGPRSFTIAGTAQAIDDAAQTISSNAKYSSMRAKKLNVTNAFHSTLVEGLKISLELMASGLQFKKPVVPVEFSTEQESHRTLSPKFVADHMRNPVYFNHAVQRLSKKYPSSIWLEIGSNSTVTNMASRAIGSSSGSLNSQFFLSMNITTDNSTTHLTSTTLSLWKAGLDIDFWQHHRSQTSHYPVLLLPPYQFEKSRHWLDLQVHSTPPVIGVVKDESLWAFEGYQDPKQQSARFRINTDSGLYKDLLYGHTIAKTAPICPATVEVEIVVEALMSLRSEFKDGILQPQILNVSNHAPVCFDSSRVLRVDITAIDTNTKTPREWIWKCISEIPGKSSSTTIHAEGQINFCSVDDASFKMEFGRYERLVNHQRCLDVLYGNDDSDDILQGPSIYRMFDDVVQYGDQYQGLQRLVGRTARNESAGRVVKKFKNETWLDAHLSDCFSQVGGIWVNCMTNRSPGDIYIANGFEKWVRSPKLRNGDSRPDFWDVLACHENRGSNAFLTDIFIFDPRSGALSEVILGINYAKVSKTSMSKLLSRLTTDMATKALVETTVDTSTSIHDSKAIVQIVAKGAQESNISSSPNIDITPRVREIIADLSGLDAAEIKDDAHLPDLGIDSLMCMELAREIEDAFSCTIPTEILMEVDSFHALVQSVESTLRFEPGVASADDITDSSAGLGDETAQTSVIQTPSEPAEEKTLHRNEVNGISGFAKPALELPSSVVLEAFAECKALTDQFIEEFGCNNYLETVMPTQTQMCIELTLDAFAELGCDLRAAKPGQALEPVDHVPSLSGLAEYLYDMLDKESGLIELDGSQVIRTTVPAPTASSSELLQILLRDAPEHSYPHKLTHFAGSRLADVLSGRSDGINVIFGSAEGRELASGLYADSPLNRLSYTQMQDFVKRLVSRLPADGTPLKILELGAGTGGTTKWVVPLLAELGIPVEYTFSDLAPSFVAAARKRFGKDYPFMKFQTVDVEKEPPTELINSQHMVLASNAVHATHSLTRSLGNIRKTLRPDGFTMILEMTRTIYWVDMIFGLLEGWWLFDDGRNHAIAHQSRWEQDLYSVGYSHVDWTDGNHPESTIQRIIVGMNGNGDSGIPSEAEARQCIVDAFVKKYTLGFSVPSSAQKPTVPGNNLCILVTGATGSLGSHIVEYLSHLPQVKTVLCLNRKTASDAHIRQVEALKSRGISSTELSKVEVIETDSSKPLLGLEQETYDELTAKVTHIIHNAWPMSGTRPLKGFEGQFKVMRNLIDLASAAGSAHGSLIGFQFISSIAVVGHHPSTRTSHNLVPEERIHTAASVLPNGYGDAKWVCERMLDETLHRYPQHFTAMAVRLGQIAGSRTSGYWNHMEHFTFMVQSSQTLRAFPNLEGVMSWTPVNDVAATLGELLLQDSSPYPIYHIDNPVRQPWSEMASVLASSIGAELVSFQEWVDRVKSYPGPIEKENPAMKLIDFFDHDYTRMSCGGLLLDTTLACKHSRTLRNVGPVEAHVTRKYVDAWKAAGFLKP